MWVETLSFLEFHIIIFTPSSHPPFLGSFLDFFFFFSCYCFLLAHPNRSFQNTNVWPISSDCFVQRPPLAHSSSSAEGSSLNFWRWMGWQLPHEALLGEGVQETLWDWSCHSGLGCHSHLGWDSGTCLSTCCVVRNISCEGWMLSPLTTVAFLIH